MPATRVVRCGAGEAAPVLDSPAVARRHIAQDHRSLAVADMIRAGLVKHRQNYGDRDIAGTVTLLYDHHNCLEVLAVRGKAGTIKRIADELIAAKGVKHGKLTVTGTGKDLPA